MPDRWGHCGCLNRERPRRRRSFGRLAYRVTIEANGDVLWRRAGGISLWRQQWSIDQERRNWIAWGRAVHRATRRALLADRDPAGAAFDAISAAAERVSRPRRRCGKLVPAPVAQRERSAATVH